MYERSHRIATIRTAAPLRRRRLPVCVARLALISVVAAFAAMARPADAEPADVLARGAYLFALAGCSGCHTDTKNKGPLLAGGAPIKTPFGTFYAPNITAHPIYGIGKWSEADFLRAMRDGVAPRGRQLFPVFPYTSFTNMTDADIKALRAYIFSLPPVAKPSHAEDVAFPFSVRFLQVFWKMLFFERGPFRPDPSKSAAWNRGAYLALAVLHCGECHTPRNMLGGLERSRWFAGTSAADGPEGNAVPNITPDPETGIGKWSRSDISTYLEIGMDPDGDVAGSLMADVIERSTSKLTSEDRAAIVTYLKSLPPIRSDSGKKK